MTLHFSLGEYFFFTLIGRETKDWSPLFIQALTQSCLYYVVLIKYHIFHFQKFYLFFKLFLSLQCPFFFKIVPSLLISIIILNIFILCVYLFQAAYFLTPLITLVYHLAFSHFFLFYNFYCDFIFLFLSDSLDGGKILTGQWCVHLGL